MRQELNEGGKREREEKNSSRKRKEQDVVDEQCSLLSVDWSVLLQILALDRRAFSAR